MKQLLPFLAAILVSGCAGSHDFGQLSHNAVRDNVWDSVKRQLLKDARFTTVEKRAISTRRPDEMDTSRSVNAEAGGYRLRWNLPKEHLEVTGQAQTLKDLSHAEIQRKPAP